MATELPMMDVNGIIWNYKPRIVGKLIGYCMMGR